MSRGTGGWSPTSEGEMSWEDIWQGMVGWLGGGNQQKLIKQVILIVLIVVAVGWLGGGFFVVGPAERGVVTQFGKFVSLKDPGLNYRLPWPIQAHNIVNVEEIRRAEIGFRTEETPGRPTRHVRVAGEAIMLTGDRNIADVQILVFYQVQDPVQFLFRAEAPELALRVNTEVALRSVIGQMRIDYAMTEGRPTIEVGTREFLQSLLDAHQTGLHVVGVELQPVRPPDEVAEAFYDVIRAKADRERVIMEAEGYTRDVVPRARGGASAIIHAATAYRDERIALAEGEAERFNKILEEYHKAPKVTRQRLFLETMERVLAGTEKFIIDPAVGNNLLQFLPLTDRVVVTPERGGK